MKILFDNNAPRPLVRFLKGHEVLRAGQMGWSRLENGDLLTAAEQAGFDVLLTCDQNLPYQQNFTDRRIAVVILPSNRWPFLRPSAPRIASAVDFAQRGQVIRLTTSELQA